MIDLMNLQLYQKIIQKKYWNLYLTFWKNEDSYLNFENMIWKLKNCNIKSNWSNYVFYIAFI